MQKNPQTTCLVYHFQLTTFNRQINLSQPPLPQPLAKSPAITNSLN